MAVFIIMHVATGEKFSHVGFGTANLVAIASRRCWRRPSHLGVFGAAWTAGRIGICRLPDGVSWWQIYGAACLAGIGFTMSLFIGTLAFSDPELSKAVRLGVLSGSTLSAVTGFLVLRYAAAPVPPDRVATSRAVKTAG